MSNLSGMSNLSAQTWSELMVKQLRKLEDTCTDDDLFCVGYLIPLVELVEVGHADEQASLAQWQQRFNDFVQQCLGSDVIQESDATRIQELVTSLKAD